MSNEEKTGFTNFSIINYYLRVLDSVIYYFFYLLWIFSRKIRGGSSDEASVSLLFVSLITLSIVNFLAWNFIGSSVIPPINWVLVDEKESLIHTLLFLSGLLSLLVYFTFVSIPLLYQTVITYSKTKGGPHEGFNYFLEPAHTVMVFSIILAIYVSLVNSARGPMYILLYSRLMEILHETTVTIMVFTVIFLTLFTIVLYIYVAVYTWISGEEAYLSLICSKPLTEKHDHRFATRLIRMYKYAIIYILITSCIMLSSYIITLLSKAPLDTTAVLQVSTTILITVILVDASTYLNQSSENIMNTIIGLNPAGKEFIICLENVSEEALEEINLIREIIYRCGDEDYEQEH